MNSYHYLLKYIVIGDSGVGKSCVVLQFTQSKTRQNHDITIGIEFATKIVKVDKISTKLQIWDTAGQENFRSITRSYYRSAIGALLVFDLTNYESFQHVKSWLEQVRVNGNPELEILLVGNKNDLQKERAVTFDEAQKFGKKHNLKYIEINSRDNEKVNEAFMILTKNILNKITTGKILVNSQTNGIKTGTQYSKLKLPKPSSSSPAKCC